MIKLGNRWNRFIYRLWSPVYDGLFDRFFVAAERRRAMAILDLKPGERVLLVGVGTGADLPLLPKGVRAVGLDLSPHMLGWARAKLPLPELAASLVQADAQLLPLGKDVFDAAVLNLILSVAPDGARCWQETLRAVRPGGRIIIFDKFLPDEDQLTLGRKLLNLLTMAIGTDITRRFGEIVAGSAYVKTHDEPSLLGGAYRIIGITKGDCLTKQV
jgi:phosphatidylethanolamine/phosphatidyl-N-methylethanolamine N-methyltransferase